MQKEFPFKEQSCETALLKTQSELQVVTNELPVVPTKIDLSTQQPAPNGATCDKIAEMQDMPVLPVLPVAPLPPAQDLQVGQDMHLAHESSPKHDENSHMSRIYYEVLVPDDSDVFYINHEDEKPIVPLDKLSSHDIDRINSSQSSAQLNYDGDTEDYDHAPYVSPSQKKKRSTYRPQRKPSKQRMAAQNAISANRAKKASVCNNTSTAAKTVEKDDSTSSSSWNESNHEPLQWKKTCGLKVTTHGIRKFKQNRNYMCPSCDQNFPNVVSLNHHYRTSHDPLPCKKCGKSFFTPSSLHHHKYEHQEKEVKCDTCGQGFLWASQLHDHMRSHQKLKPYPYRWTYKDRTKCKKEFFYIWDFNCHMASHKAVPLKCKHCDYTTVDKRNLSQHLRRHSGLKPYKCGKCGMVFSFSSQRARHKC